MATKQDVAAWMADQLKNKKYLDQEQVVQEIKKVFGDDFVFINANGNLGIVKPVLDVFKELTPDAVWSRSDRAWRERKPHDKAGRMQE